MALFVLIMPIPYFVVHYFYLLLSTALTVYSLNPNMTILSSYITCTTT